MPRFRPLVWLTICSLLYFCNSQRPEGLSAQAYVSDMPTRDELMAAFRQNRKILIVYGSLNQEVADDYARLAQQMSGRARYATFEVKPCSAVTPEDWQEKAIVLIGSSRSNSLLHRILNDIPFRLLDKKIGFDGRDYNDPSTVAMLSFYPNPLKKTLPISIITALNDDTLRQFLEFKMADGWRLFSWSAWNYEIYKHQKRLLLGMFNPINWTIDKKVHFDFSAGAAPVMETAHFRFIAHYKDAEVSDLQPFAEAVETAAESIRHFIDSTKTLPVFECHFYASAEEKALMLNNARHAHADFERGEVHVVFNEIFWQNWIGRENELIIRQLLGKPKTCALELGLAIRFTQRWQFKGYQYWAQRLFASGNMLSLAELLNNEWLEKESPLVTGCLAASFTDFLIEHWGREAFLSQYAVWKPDDSEIKDLEKAWYLRLAAQAAYISTEERSPQELPYLKGFNFAHEGYAIYNGYLSKLATESIEKQAKTLHCNALAIVPYSYMESPFKPSFIPIADSPGEENDEGVIHSVWSAKQQGMAVMLKPQLWMGRGYWPGDIAMTNEPDWQQFFADYYRWLRHYSLLAEIWNIDLLCVGTELAKTTQVRGKEWRAMIKKLRGLYRGRITYAANWGAEFENFAFADALDYLGVDCYYPLSDDPNANKEALTVGFRQVMQKLEKVQKRSGKPLIFTEIGFKSVKAPWINPHESSGNAPYFGEHQRLCYEVVLENIYNKPWIRGIFWWKYPSYLDFRGAENDDFNPNRKPAEQVVQQWFAKMP